MNTEESKQKVKKEKQGSKTNLDFLDNDLVYTSFIDAVKQSITLAVTLNGGALVGLISVISQKSLEQASAYVGILKCAAFAFTVGVILGALSALTTYLAQFSYYKSAIHQKPPFLLSATTWRLILLVLLFMSVFAFAAGCFSVISNLASLNNA